MSHSAPRNFSNAELRAALALVDSAISTFTDQLQELERYRWAVMQLLGRIVYPGILSLPNEITTEIFLQCLSADPVSNVNSHTFPLIPLGVCRAWRTLAISTPRLWTHLALDLRSSRIRPRLDDLRDMVDTWFTRSEPHRATLRIQSRSWEQGDAGSEAIRPILHQYGPRLRSIHLEITAEHYATIAAVQSFPVLEDLVLTVAENGELSPAQLFSNALRLTRLRLCCSRHTPPSSLLLPYQQLTKLDFNELSLDDLASILRNATILEDLDCSLYHGDQSTFVAHDTLQTLTLRRHTSRRVYRYLHFPALQSFTMHHPQYDNLPEQEFCAFMKAASQSLVRYSYHGFRGPSRCPMEFTWLALAPNLTDITLTNIDSAEKKPTDYSVVLSEFVRKLDRRHHRDFLPKLQSLEMEDHRFGVELGVLVRALASRCDSDTHAEVGGHRAVLRSFRLVGVESGSGYEKLRYFVGRGMRVHVGPNRETNLV